MEKIVTSLGELKGAAEVIALGHHLIAEIWSGDPQTLDDPLYLRESVQIACEAGELTVLDILVHEFSPHGVTLIALLAESHLSIHTWPEHGYAAVDVFACDGDPDKALEVLVERLHAVHVDISRMERGILWPGAPLDTHT